MKTEIVQTQSNQVAAAVALIPYADIERMATAIARSQLFGVKDTVQAIALCLIAQAEGMHPAIAARDYNIISGRPSLKAEAMLSRFQAAGGKVQWHRLDAECAEATFSHPSGGAVRIDWTIEQAARVMVDEWAGPKESRRKIQKPLTEKDNWKNYPRAMLRSRCISEGVRTIYPSATNGLYTPEEIRDMPPAEREVPGEVVMMRPTPPQPKHELDSAIGEESEAYTAISAKLAEYRLDIPDTGYVEAIIKRKFPDHAASEEFRLCQITMAQQRWLMSNLQKIAVRKLLDDIPNLPAQELQDLYAEPPSFLGTEIDEFCRRADAQLRKTNETVLDEGNP